MAPKEVILHNMWAHLVHNPFSPQNSVLYECHWESIRPGPASLFSRPPPYFFTPAGRDPLPRVAMDCGPSALTHLFFVLLITFCLFERPSTGRDAAELFSFSDSVVAVERSGVGPSA